MSKKKQQARKSRRRRKGEPDNPMLFSTFNYYIMLVGVFMVLMGFLAMYLENLEKGIIALYISPIIIIGGFAVVVAAILITDKKQIESELTDSTASDG